jgi:hypothetical protein
MSNLRHDNVYIKEITLWINTQKSNLKKKNKLTKQWHIEAVKTGENDWKRKIFYSNLYCIHLIGNIDRYKYFSYIDYSSDLISYKCKIHIADEYKCRLVNNYSI